MPTPSESHNALVAADFPDRAANRPVSHQRGETKSCSVTVTDPHTGQRWSYPQRSRFEARRLALRLRRAGYVATYGSEPRSTLPRALRLRWALGLLSDLHRARRVAS